MIIRKLSDLKKIYTASDRQIQIAEDTYVKRMPEKGDCVPDPNYQLRCTLGQIISRMNEFYAAIGDEDENCSAMAEIMLKKFEVYPETLQNLDEWTQKRQLSPIPFGPLGLTIPFIIERRRLFGYGSASDNMYEIAEGFLDYYCGAYQYYPFFPSVCPIRR